VPTLCLAASTGRGDMPQHQFADEFLQLPLKERVNRSRAFAAEAKQSAVGAAPHLRAAFLDLALADEMERHG
jgi:hypothetical protein